MAINKKLIHFKTKAAFEKEKANILDTSIVFIKDSQQIYTHGQLYDCFGLSEQEIIQLIGLQTIPGNDFNMDECLESGIYPWCATGRPSGSIGHYTLVVRKSSTPDYNGFYTVEQTAFGREGDEGKVYKRLIFIKDDGTSDFHNWVNVSSAKMMFAGTISGNTVTSNQLTGWENSLANNEQMWFIIGNDKDETSGGTVTFNSTLAQKTHPEDSRGVAANLGDILIICKDTKGVVDYKVLPVNDAKSPSDDNTFPGTYGILTPNDRMDIDNAMMQTYDEANMNNALKSGFYPYCTLGRPQGCKENDGNNIYDWFTCVVQRSRQVDYQGFFSVIQTAFGRGSSGNLYNKIFKRVIFYNPSDREKDNYGEWVEISYSNDLPLEKGSGNESIQAISTSVIDNPSASGEKSVALGHNTTASGNFAFAEGYNTVANDDYSHSEGYYTIAKNNSEHASGRYNVPLNAENGSFGLSKRTLFTVGNGYNDSKRHNAIDIRQNGDVYIPDTEVEGEYYEKPMLHLQKDLARINGKYPDLTAGHAVNLDGTTDIVSDSAYRPTGGDEDVLFGTASIQNIKGNSVAWNQLIKNGNFANGTTNWSINSNSCTASVASGVVTLTKTGDANPLFLQTLYGSNLTPNHKFLYRIECNKSAIEVTVRSNNGSLALSNTKTGVWETLSGIVTGTANITTNLQFQIKGEGQYRNCIVLDLTLIYGAGNEPSTPEQFEEDYQRWFGRTLEYEEYDAGSIRSTLATDIKTVGFNLAPFESWEGTNSKWSTTFSKNGYLWKNDCGYKGQMVINAEVAEGSSSTMFSFVYTDGTSNYIKLSNGTSTTSNNPYFGRLISTKGKTVAKITGSYGTGGLNGKQIDVLKLCISFLWSGKREKDYESRWEETQSLPITTLKGKLNGEGESVVVFPDGMKRVGDICDEIKIENGVTKAIKRVGVISDLTENIDFYLCWSEMTSAFPGTPENPSPTILYWFTNSKIVEKYKMNANTSILCSLYPKGDPTSNKETQTKCIGITSDGALVVRDESFINNPTAFEKYIKNQPLYYELAEPEEYVIDDFELPVIYKIDDFGTEQIIQPTNSVAPTITSTYGLNAVDSIRRMSSKYATKSELSGYVKIDTYNELKARVEELEELINKACFIN